MKHEYIVCSAIWYIDLPTQNLLPTNITKGIVVCGLRHGNIISCVKSLSQLRTVQFAPDAVGEHEQGFLTNTNLFVNREQAAKIAFDAGQIQQKIPLLHSEDIW